MSTSRQHTGGGITSDGEWRGAPGELDVTSPEFLAEVNRKAKEITGMPDRAVRIKVQVAEVTRRKTTVYNEGKPSLAEVQSIKMHVVIGRGGDDAQSEEDKRFFAATPSGSVEFGTINADAAARFDLGASFYVDFTRAD